MRKENLTEVFDAILCISELHNLYLEYDIEDKSYWISKSIKISSTTQLKEGENLLNIELFSNNIIILKFDYKSIADRIALCSFKDLRMVLNIMHRFIGKNCKHCMGV